MRLLSLHVPLLAAAIATISACPGGDTDNEVTSDDFVDASVEFFENCDFFGAFGEQEPLFVAALKPQSIASIKASLKAQLASPNITFNADVAAACIAAMESASCNAADLEAIDACDGVIVGTLALGDSCAFDEECADDNATCFGLTTDGCGVCTSAVELGDDCSAADCTNSTCRDNVCVAIEPDLEAGDACTDTDTCADGLDCSEGVCAPVVVVQVGAACNDTTAYCINTATTNFCNTDGICSARPTTGGDCSEVPLCDSTAGVCGDDGTCVVGGAEGATCTSALDCLTGLQCDGTCKPFFTANEPPVCE